jgi:WD40 repeat protein
MIVLKGLDRPTYRLEFAPDGRAVLATGSGGAACEGAVWTLPNVGPPLLLPDLSGATFAPDGRSLIALEWALSREPRFGRIDLAAGGEFTGRTVECPPIMVNALVTLSPDSTRVAWHHTSGNLSWWSWPDLTPMPAWADNPGVKDFTFSPDGSVVAVLKEGAGVRWHEATTGAVLRRAELKTIFASGCITWSPDGRYVAAGSGKRLRVFDARDGTMLIERTQASKHFLDVAFTRDGRFLATVSNETTVKFFDASSWSLHHELAWDIGGLRAIAFSRDGMLAAAGGVRGKVVVWDFDL